MKRQMKDNFNEMKRNELAESLFCGVKKYIVNSKISRSYIQIIAYLYIAAGYYIYTGIRLII